jgi:hypothetical protein
MCGVACINGVCGGVIANDINQRNGVGLQCGGSAESGVSWQCISTESSQI